MMDENFPTLYQVLGSSRVQRNIGEIEKYVQTMMPWFIQLESDLLGLMGYVGLDELVSCFRSALRDKTQIQQAIYEVHGCHLMASIAGNIRLHVPLEEGRKGNFDFQVNIMGELVSGDVKTREDRFPFGLPPQRNENGIEIFEGTRATLDPNKASRLNIPAQSNVDVGMPESTVIERLLEKSLMQLPTCGQTIVIVGQLRGNSDAEIDLQESLFGTEGLGYKKNTEKLERFRYPTGIFCGLPGYEHFNRLSGVISVKLSRMLGNEMKRVYRFYPNPAANEPIPDAVAKAIESTFHQWESTRRKPE